jgi:ribulose-bisphosphate carboxylase large chain
MGNDIVAQFGGGCHGHPDGTYAGAKAIRQAMEATQKGVSLQEYAQTHLELSRALEKWADVRPTESGPKRWVIKYRKKREGD